MTEWLVAKLKTATAHITHFHLFFQHCKHWCVMKLFMTVLNVVQNRIVIISIENKIALLYVLEQINRETHSF